MRGGNLVWLPCDKGMHQEFGAKAAPPGTIYSCTNSRLDADGVLVKRGGMLGLAGTVTIATGPYIKGDGSTSFVEKPSFMVRAGDVPCVGTTAGCIFGLNSLSSGNVFHFQGRFSTCKPVKRRAGLMGTVAGSTTFSDNPGATAVNSEGYIAYGGVSDDKIASQIVIENPDGLRLFSGNAASLCGHAGGVGKLQLAVAGTTFVLITQADAGTAVRAVTLQPDGTDVNVGSSAAVGTLTSSTARWDTTTYDSTNWYLVHQSAVGTLRVDKFAGTSSAANATFAVTGTCPVSIWGNTATGHIWVGYYNNPTVSGDVRYRIRAASDLTSVLTETTIASAVNVYGPPLFGNDRDPTPGSANVTTKSWFVFRYVEAAGSLLRAMYYGTAATDGGVDLTTNPLWHVLPISKPDNYRRVWCMTDNGGTNFIVQRAVLINQCNVARQPTIELVSTPFFGGAFGGTGPSGSSMYFHAIATGSTRSYFAFPLILNLINGSTVGKLEVYEYTTGAQSPHVDACRLGGFTALAGQPVELFGKPSSQSASLTAVTSGGAAEIGFLAPPVIISVTNGGAVGTNSHSYRATYEWTDAFGRRHQSAPSPPVAIATLTAVINTTVNITTCDVTQRVEPIFPLASGPSITLWRTTSGGTSYQSVGSFYGTGETDGFISVGDVVTDANLGDEQFLYTDGGVQSHDIGPSCRFMAFSEDRLWLGGLWDPSVIQCSKVIIPGEPIQFTDHEAFQVTLLGECTGLAYMDGNLVAFTEEEIYLFGGEGPNDQGIGGFPPPRKMAQGVGCIDYRSIVETNAGVMFQSRRGIELLPRGFGPVQYVGKAVKDVFQVDGLTEVIAAGVFMGSKNNTARFMVKNPAGTSTTTVLVYDIDRGEWTRDMLQQASSCLGGWPDGFVCASTDFNSGTFTHPFLYEDGSQTGDGAAGSASYVAQTITWNRVYPFGSPIAWGAVNRAQVSLEAMDATAGYGLSLSLRADENATQTTPSTYSFSTISSGTQFWREFMLPQNRKCSGVTITLTDSQSPSTGGAGFKIHGVGLEIEPEPNGGIHIVNGAAERQ